MNAEKLKSVAIRKDTYGNVIEVLEIKTCNKGEIEELKSLAIENSKKQVEHERELEIAKKSEVSRAYIVACVVAKCQFNELVESGKCETTNEFEEDYDKFILGGKLDLSKAPIKYQEILGRLTR